MQREKQFARLSSEKARLEKERAALQADLVGCDGVCAIGCSGRLPLPWAGHRLRCRRCHAVPLTTGPLLQADKVSLVADKESAIASLEDQLDETHDRLALTK